jgi:predicted TIM-barrel fold metal-dependent hydrolase
MPEVIDVSGFLGRWPFRGIPRSSNDDLHRQAERLHIRKVVVSSFENLFWENAADAAREFARSIEGDELLVHFPIVNPVFPGVLDDLKRLQDERPFRGVRLLSNYHGYSLTDPAVDRLIDWTRRQGLIVQVFRRIVDERLHWMLKVPPVPDEQLNDLVRRHAEQQFIMSALWFNEIAGLFETMGKPAHVRFDVSRCRGPEEWPAKLIASVPGGQLVFGSLWPLQVIRSTLEELLHAPIDEGSRSMILSQNAAGLIGAI